MGAVDPGPVSRRLFFWMPAYEPVSKPPQCTRSQRRSIARSWFALHPEKTRLVEFGCNALAQAERTGSKLATFDFLGFTYKCARSRRGKFTVHIKTMKKRLKRAFTAAAAWCREHRHDPVDIQQHMLNAKLRGHYQYYGRPTNYHSVWQFYRGVRRLWHKWLNRRTRGKSLSWNSYVHLLQQHPLLCPRIMHAWNAR